MMRKSAETKSKSNDFTPDIPNKSTKNQMKSIKIDISPEDYQYLSQQAREMKISLRSLAKMKTLDRNLSVDMTAKKIMQMMPEFYRHVNQVEDPYLQQKLTDFGGAICRYLK